MTAKAEVVRTPVPNRCSCGHLPTDHMVVRPVHESGIGSYALVAEGGCARCGTACTRFAAVP
jgi:hypothetical protein